MRVRTSLAYRNIGLNNHVTRDNIALRESKTMSVIAMTLTVLYWIIAFSIGWLILIRVVRHFVHFPIPAFVAQLIDNPIRRQIQPPTKVVDWIDMREGMHVLEMGPGAGTFTIMAANRVGEKGRIYAVDIQPSVISKLDCKLQRDKITNVTTKVASAYEFPFSNRTFDRVFMIAVLGEIPDKKRVLFEIKRVLKDNGLLAIGEFLPDPDCPRRKTVIDWCKGTGFELINGYGGLLHYLLTFQKSIAEE